MRTIEDLKAAYAAATPGELYADEERFCKRMESIFKHGPVLGVCAGEKAKANAHLIALMHNALPALIECAKALRGLTTVCDAGQSADYRALQELRTMREARAALAKLENHNA